MDGWMDDFIDTSWWSKSHCLHPCSFPWEPRTDFSCHLLPLFVTNLAAAFPWQEALLSQHEEPPPPTSEKKNLTFEAFYLYLSVKNA